MDRKSIIVIIVCFVLLMLWSSVIVPKIYPPLKVAPGSTNTLAATSGTITSNIPATTPTLGAAPTPGTAPAAAPATRVAVNPHEPEVLLVMTNHEARYTFTSHGGGLKEVELLHYPETVPSRRGKQAETHRLATLNAQASTPTLAILGGEAIQGDGIFTLTQTATGVRAKKTLGNGLTVTKDFSLGTNYLVSATVRMENHSGNTLSLPAQEWVVGTATPMSRLDDGQASVGWMWYDGKSEVDTLGAGFFSTRNMVCMPRTPPAEYRAGQNNVVWAAAYNQFFTLMVMPKTPGAEIASRKVNLPPPGAEDLRQDPRTIPNPAGYETVLVYPPLTLSNGQSEQREFQLFTGPKEYRTLASIAARFNNNADLIMGFGWFGFFSKGLLLSMNWLHSALGFTYGWAIIAITVIIKILFWPLTQASTRSMKRMSALQPQMKAIADKYKDDPVKRNQKTMEFMKENKVNPMGGCLPMLLQMPVFIGFFYMIRSAIELRGAPFLWVADLSRPDTIFLIPGLNFPVNPLPLLMGGTMLWQSHLTPPSPGMDPMQQKIMRYMPLMFLVILYNFSAGLTLYWTVQNLLTIAQMKLTKNQAVPVPAATVLTPLQKKRK